MEPTEKKISKFEDKSLETVEFECKKKKKMKKNEQLREMLNIIKDTNIFIMGLSEGGRRKGQK